MSGIAIGIAIGIGLLLLVAAAAAVARREEGQYGKWKEWFDSLPYEERRRIQEECYRR